MSTLVRPETTGAAVVVVVGASVVGVVTGNAVVTVGRTGTVPEVGVAAPAGPVTDTTMAAVAAATRRRNFAGGYLPTKVRE